MSLGEFLRINSPLSSEHTARVYLEIKSATAATFLGGGSCMDRIIVIGPPGSGKTTLCKRLSELTGAPRIDLDDLQIKDDGHPVPNDEWQRIMAEVIAQDRWILDGGRLESLEQDLVRADTVVVVHIPRLRSFYQWVKREARSKDQWLKWRWRALWLAWSWASLAMPRVWAKIEVNKREYGYKIVHLATRDMIDRYVARLEREYGEKQARTG